MRHPARRLLACPRGDVPRGPGGQPSPMGCRHAALERKKARRCRGHTITGAETSAPADRPDGQAPSTTSNLSREIPGQITNFSTGCCRVDPREVSVIVEIDKIIQARSVQDLYGRVHILSLLIDFI